MLGVMGWDACQCVCVIKSSFILLREASMGMMNSE